MSSPWNPFNYGFIRLRKQYRVRELISGTRLWWVSGSVTDGNFNALYQCSLNVVVGKEGIQFTSSFWLPRFMATYILIPWQDMSAMRIHTSSFEFVVDNTEILLVGKRVVDAVKTYGALPTNPK
jgi:hypothetical protein